MAKESVPQSVKNEVLVRQHYRCVHCGNELEAVKHFHHIKSRSEGGSNDPSNIMALCTECHNREHHKKQLEKQKETEKEERPPQQSEFEPSEDWSRIGF